jgi:Dna[CI] antecedent, DciA
MLKKKNDLTLQEAMKAMLQEYKLAPQFNETRVKMLWGRLMGKTISTYTSEISVRKNVLYLTILSASLKHELSFGKDKIKNLLNEELGEDFIKEVVIR